MGQLHSWRLPLFSFSSSFFPFLGVAVVFSSRGASFPLPFLSRSVAGSSDPFALDPQCNSKLCGSPSWLNHRGFAVFWGIKVVFMDAAMRVRRRRVFTLLDMLETVPQVADYLVPCLTSNENNLMVSYLCQVKNYDGSSNAIDYYIRVYFTQFGWGYALLPPVSMSHRRACVRPPFDYWFKGSPSNELQPTHASSAN